MNTSLTLYTHQAVLDYSLQDFLLYRLGSFYRSNRWLECNKKVRLRLSIIMLRWFIIAISGKLYVWKFDWLWRQINRWHLNNFSSVGIWEANRKNSKLHLDPSHMFYFGLWSSRGGLGVERLLHKKHDSAPVDQSPLGTWYRLYISRLHHHPS